MQIYVNIKEVCKITKKDFIRNNSEVNSY